MNHLHAEALRIFDTCVSFNINLNGESVSALEFPIKFDESFEVTSVPFFILRCELDKGYTKSFYINIALK